MHFLVTQDREQSIGDESTYTNQLISSIFLAVPQVLSAHQLLSVILDKAIT